ncbi:hypothetical protein M2G96_20660 [Vibrio vulnificus]|nr:hypothetical protein [Vibrio vulnificus]EIO3996952.1 hypothetical protein [Vibrio vulnificus]MCU8216688.1 hypothetical protein [Vibrio vulnificus]
MLIIERNSKFSKELDYIIKVIFTHFLHVDFQISDSLDKTKLTMFSSKDGNRKIEFDLSFFNLIDDSWGVLNSLPKEPLKYYSPSSDGIDCLSVEPTLPVFYSSSNLPSISFGDTVSCNIDFFGTIFFVLSSYEEFVLTQRDKLGRFISKYSILNRENLIERPVVDEYIALLFSLINTTFPNVNACYAKFDEKFITCDVDWPEDPSLSSWKVLCRDVLVKLIKDKKPLVACGKIFNFSKNKLGLSYKDEYLDNVYRIMKENEILGNKVSFYFIPKYTSNLDSCVDYSSKNIKTMISEIISRGHKFGIHPGYGCYKNEDFFKSSLNTFKIIQSEYTENKSIESRMHFLRWDIRKTPQLMEKYDVVMDSTLGFADAAGFRVGTSKTFNMYDLAARKPLKIIQRPLIAMECSIISSRYQNLGYSEESLNKFKLLRSRCKMFGGTFTLLWHNSFFYNNEDWEFYKELID